MLNQDQNNNIINSQKVNSGVWIWLILILLITVFFRLWQIQSIPPGLYPDEAMNGNNALEALKTGEFIVFYPENNGREGLFINIQAVSLAIFGNKPWALRLPSAIFGILTALGIFFLTKELFKNAPPKSQTPNPCSVPKRSFWYGVKSQITNYKQFKIWKFSYCKLFGNWILDIRISRGEKIALLASFFLAASFWHINFSRIGFRAIMAPAFLVWSLFLLLKALNQTKNNSQFSILNSQSNSDDLIFKQKKKYSVFYILYPIFSGLIFGLGFYSYIAYRVTPLLILTIFLLYWLNNKETAIRKKFLFFVFCFSFFVFLTVLPLLWHFYNNPQDFFGRTAQISIFLTDNPLAELEKNILKTFGMFWYRGDYNWRHNYSGAPQLWWPIGILFALGIIISVMRILKNQNVKTQISKIFPEILLLSWFIISLLPVVISSEGLPHALRAIIVLPPVMMISAIGFEWLIAAIKNWLENQKLKYPAELKKLNRIQKELLILLFVFLSAVIAHNYNQYFLRWANHPEVYNAFNQNYVDIANYLNSLPKDLPKYVIVNVSGIDIGGIPMPSQTVMFITKTYLPRWQKEKNIYYYGNAIPVLENGCAKNCVIAMLENDPLLRRELKEKIPGLQIDMSPGFVILKK